MLELITPTTPQQLSETRSLFEEYASGLGVNLCFQDFERELRELPGKYQEPEGLLLLARYDSKIAGCCALRPLSLPDHPHAAEMKRLYVRPEFRGIGLGRKLVEELFTRAHSLGYAAILLDTLPSMGEAQDLYRKLGFVEIPAYYQNSIAGAKYLKLNLLKA